MISEHEKQNADELTPEDIRAERVIEAIGDIRDRYGILFISCQPEQSFKGLGLAASHEDARGLDREWFVKALGLPLDTDRVRTIYAPEGNLPTTVPESGIIIGGSKHSVYEDQPWIRNLEEFLRGAAALGKPMLGVCFGHQLIAQTFGGTVEKGTKGWELGIANVNLDKDSGISDPLFEGVAAQFPSAMSHQDIVTHLPPLKKTAVLARNDMYAHQALAIGDRIRSVQFHPEIDRRTLEQIVTARKDILFKEGITSEEGWEDFMASLRRQPIEAVGQTILRNFDRNFLVQYGQQH